MAEADGEECAEAAGIWRFPPTPGIRGGMECAEAAGKRWSPPTLEDKVGDLPSEEAIVSEKIQRGRRRELSNKSDNSSQQTAIQCCEARRWAMKKRQQKQMEVVVDNTDCYHLCCR